MRHLLLACLLLCTAPLAAQTADGRASVPSGAGVRVFLPGGVPGGVAGMLVGATGDTLRVISPALGLARLPADSIQRLEVAGRRAGTAWKYPAMVLGLAAGAGAGAQAGGDDFFPMFMNGLVAFSIIGGIAYAIQGPERRPAAIDPRAGLVVVPGAPEAARIPVRVSTASLPLAEHRLHDFTADSLYLFANGTLTPLPRVEITSLQVSLGRDRRLGRRRGMLIGAVAGGALAGGAMASLGDWGLLMSPFGVVAGGAVGLGVGGPVGWALAPRAWSDVPVQRPER